jgi:3-methyladenine DNA glycosylase AlkC
MAEPLKYMYNPAFFGKLCPVMCATMPNFDCKDFIFRVFNNRWPDLELKERVRHIAVVLHEFLPAEFPQAAFIVINLSKRLSDILPKQNFSCMFLPDYIEVFGMDHPDESLSALEEITKLVSAEFAVRPFIVHYPKKAIKKLLEWSKHKDAYVRRLASEGCRPRLPWAMALPAFKKDPWVIIPVLENLKADESEYVRRSVANNLNDIAKDNPQLVMNIARSWSGGSADTQSIIKHGCRTLLKKGNSHMLKLHGFDPKNKAVIKNLELQSRRIKIGDALHFNFDFINEQKKPARFRLEYAIDYITSTGKSSRKIFKITENQYSPKTTIKIARKQSFKNLTTRKHFKGEHTVSILVNGQTAGSAKFRVL